MKIMTWLNMFSIQKRLWQWHKLAWSQRSATSVTLHLLRPIEEWRDIWKHTVDKSQTNVSSVIMPPLMHTIWGHIWKHTVDKSQTNATYVALHLNRQAIWGHIWKHTGDKSQVNATSVTLHLQRQAIWKHKVGKRQSMKLHSLVS